MQKSSNENTTGFTTKAEFAVGVLVNKTRFAQGWTALPIAELKPVAQDWLYHLERHGAPAVHYQAIIDRAVDHRIMHLAKGEKPPMLSVELLLAMFRELKVDLHEKCQEIKKEFKILRGLLANASESSLTEPQERQIIGRANVLLRSELDSIEKVRDGLKIVVDSENREIENFWKQNHLPDEAKEWLN